MTISMLSLREDNSTMDFQLFQANYQTFKLPQQQITPLNQIIQQIILQIIHQFTYHLKMQQILHQ